jgi:subtilase family serine protease
MTNLIKTSSLPLLRSVICASAALLGIAAAPAQTLPSRPQARITSSIDNSVRTTLPGSRLARLSTLSDAGALPPSTPVQGVTLVFSLSAAQQADLQSLVADQQNAASPFYHQWLTPTQFGARFGAADSDIAAVQNWLQQQGFALGTVSNSRDRISFSGTAAQMQTAFGTSLHNFRSSDDATTHFAPISDISLPAAIAPAVLGVANLSSFKPHSHAIIKNTIPHFTSATSGNHFLTPGDVSTIYDIKAAYAAGYTGTGQTIVVVGQSSVIASDITNFQTAAGITNHAPTLYLVTGSGTSTTPVAGDESESDLDLEYSSSIAPGATIAFVYTGNNTNYGAFDSIQFAVDNKLGNIISSSYGACEISLTSQGFGELENILAQAATQGQSIVSASGDAGSTDCSGTTGITVAQQETPSVDYPASSNFVTGMGGTEFPSADILAGNNTYFTAQGSTDTVSSALSYIPEQAWNDDAAPSSTSAGGLSSGGGGVSIFSLRPPWQTGVAGIASSTYRTVPDISLDSSPNNAGYAYCTSDTSSYSSGQANSCNSGFRDSVSGDLTVAGGTSFAAPIFSGMLALINQAKAPSGQGLVNPTLYSLASNATTYATAFHDITSGSNECLAGATFCASAGTTAYVAGTGYDLATGIGSVDLNALLTAWPKVAAAATSSASFALSVPSTTIKAGSSGTATITVTPSNGYTGTVYFSLSSLSNGLNAVCFSAANATVSSTGAVTSTVNIATNLAACATGASPFVKGSGTSTTSTHAPAGPLPYSPWKHAPVPSTLAGLLLMACLSRRSRRLRSLSLALVAVAALGATAGLSGCSSSAASTAPNTTTTTTTTTSTTGTTPTGTYTITVAGFDQKSSTITASTSFTLTVD